MFCPIFRVSSTFLTRLFYSLRLFGEVKNPYRIPIGQALQAKTHNLNELLPLKGSPAQKFLSNATSFLLVREPLSRLFSGFMNKLFAPNPYFWNKVGNYIVSRYSLDICVTKDQLADWKKDVVKDAIIDSVESPFLWRHRVSKCMPWSSSMKRVVEAAIKCNNSPKRKVSVF